ncbi:MAG: SseB family protein [Sporichthyaceae bacterium]
MNADRVLSDPGFGGDDGAADPSLAAALAGYAAGDPVPLAHLLPTARLLVPIVAILDELDANGAEKSTDMAVVTLKLTNGQTALPAFTSLATLAQWHPDARPLPIEGARAAQAAIFENADLLLIDPAGPVAAPVVGPALRTLAAGRPPLPVHLDPDVAQALRGRVAARPELAAAVLLPAEGDAADAILAVVPHAGADAAAAVAALSDVLAADPVLAGRLGRGLDLAVLPAGTALPADRLY